MAKRIFKIIGIVLGCVTALIGVVVGILALQGKFNTPILYPEDLVFLNNNSIVVADKYRSSEESDPETMNNLDEPTDDTRELAHFYLKGTNSNKEHEVNRPKCYIWFVDNIGADLITLCDEDGEPLEANEKSEYLVNCNENIYYTFDPLTVENMETTDGKVRIRARGEKGDVYCADDLIIWIDREVKSVALNKDSDTTLIYDETNDKYSQSIEIGLGGSIEINYLVKPEISLTPTSSESGESSKVIELYYSGDADAYLDEYALVNKDTIISNEDLAGLFEYKDDKLTFLANKVGRYYFYIAMFPTYEARDEYREKYANITSNVSKVNNELMLATNLTIRVVPSDVEKVNMSSSGVNLNLFKKNYISINGTTTINGKTSQNLGITMLKDINDETSSTTIRYDEIKFNSLYSMIVNNKLSLKEPGFVNTQNEYKSLSEINSASNKTINCSNVLSSVPNGENNPKEVKIINDIEIDGKFYKCSNGIAIMVGEEIKLLEAGSYIDIYTYSKGEETYSLIDTSEYFDIETIADYTDSSLRTWRIIPKQLLDTDKTYKIGILVVNDTGLGVDDAGLYTIDNYFASTELKVEEESLKVTTIDEDINLYIEYSSSISYDSKNVEDIITVNGGSYNKCLLVVKEASEYPIKVLKDYTFEVKNPTTNTNTKYVLVGYIENGVFYNDVVANNCVGTDAIDLSYVQLSFEYKDIDMSSEEYLIKLITDSKTNELVESIDLKDYAISVGRITNLKVIPTISTNATLSDLFTVNYFDDYSTQDKKYTDVSNNVLQVFASSTDHAIVMTERHIGMLDALEKYYGDVNNGLLPYVSVDNDNIVIDGVSIGEINTEITPPDDNTEPEVSPVNVIDDEPIDDPISGDVNNLLLIQYTAKNQLTNGNHVTISFGGESIGKTIEVAKIFIKSSTPEKIVYRYNTTAGEGGEINTQDIELSTNGSTITNTLTITIEYSAEEYTYSYDLDGVVLDDGITFNNVISSDRLGFQDPDYKNVNYSVTYTSTDTNIFSIEGTDTKSIKVNKCGNAILEIKIGETTAYINVLVVANEFEFKTTNNRPAISDGGDLNSFISYSYGENGIPLNSKFIAISNVEVMDFGGGVDKNTLGVTYDEDSNNISIYEPTTEKTIMTISSGNDGWEFSRTDDYKYTPITITFDVSSVVGDIRGIQLTMKSDITVSYNTDTWGNSDSLTLYHGTSVQLFEVYSDSTTMNAIMNIKVPIGKENSLTFSYIQTSNKNAEESEQSTKINTSSLDLGTYEVHIYVDGQKLPNILTFTVAPNLIVEGNVDVPTIYTETEYNWTQIANWYSYDANPIYGSETYGTYAADYRVESIFPTNYSKDVTITVTDDLSTDNLYTIDTDNRKVTIWSNNDLNLNKENVTLTIKYGDYTLGTATVNIQNKYQVNGLNLTSIEASVPVDLSGVTITNADDFSIKKVTVVNNSNITFTIDKDNNKITLNTIKEEYTNCQLEFTFTINGEEYTYTYTTDANITLTPYVPELVEVGDLGTLKTCGKFNISGIFNDTTISDTVSTIVLDSMTYEDGSSVGAYEDSELYNNTGFKNCNITIADFAGNSKTAKITFTVYYTDGQEYQDTYEDITIYNRTSIVVNYPESDLKYNEVYLKFNNDDEAKLFLGENATADYKGAYLLNSEKSYEPILVHSNADIGLDLCNSSLLSIKRIAIDNNGKIESIEKVGYEVQSGFDTYFNAITIEGTKITFPSVTAGTHGYVIFKITTESGNYAYYTTYIYSTDESALDMGNPPNTTRVTVNPNDTSDLMTLLKDASLDWAEFGLTSSTNVSLYLLEASSLGDLSGQLSTTDILYSNVTETKIEKVNSFTTLRLAVVYQDAKSINQKFCAGVLTVELEPTYTISAADGFDYKGNGEYSYTISAGTSSVTVPFSVSVDSVSKSLTAGEIVSCENNALSIVMVEENNNYEIRKGKEEILSLKDGVVSISKYVDTDIRFSVVYTFDNNLKLKVNYIYKAVKLPQDTSTYGKNVGEYSNSGFNNTVAISDIIGSEYAGDVTITGEGFTRNYNELTFTQSANQQNVTLTFTYDDLVSISGKNSAEITFTVLSDINLATDYSGTAHGLGNNNPMISTPKGDYTSATGSSISITKLGNNYTIGGLTINLGKTDYKLRLTFSDNEYVVFDEDDKDNKIDLNGDRSINFVHLAATKDIIMYVDILDGGTVIAGKQTTMYIRISKTYTGIVANYAQSGATHENVASGTSITTGNLLDSGYLYLVYTKYNEDKKKDEYITIPIDSKLKNDIGFIDTNNPNYITFFTGDDSEGITLKSDGSIIFSTVSENKLAKLYLKNNAGLSTVSYQYQIMASRDVDGIDYTTCSGVHDYVGSNTEYVSYTLSDENKAKDKEGNDLDYYEYILGTLTDKENKSVFNIKSISVDKTLSSSTQSTDEETNIITYEYKYTDDSTISVLFNAGEIRVRFSGSITNELKVSIKMTGMTFTLCDDSDSSLDIMFFNYNINSLETVPSVPASSSVNIANVFELPSGLKCVFNGGEYSYATTEVTLSESESSNNLFEYNEGNKVITFGAVGTGVNAKLNFYLLNSDGYKIKTIDYEVNVIRSLVFLANGDTYTSGDATSNTTLETDLYLVNNTTASHIKTSGNNFPITITVQNTIEYNKADYNETQLAFSLYNTQKVDTTISHSLVTLKEDSARLSGAISISKNSGVYSITFNKDYNGRIYLKLSYATQCGTYEVDWIINVTPIIKFTVSNDVIENNSNSFNSNTQVTPFTTSTDDNNIVGRAVKINMSNQTIGSPSQPATIVNTIKADYSYVVLDNATNYADFVEAYKKNTPSSMTSDEFTTINTVTSLNITLPVVPTTTSQLNQYYIVIYKFTVKYLEQSRDIYVAYKVINIQTVAVSDFTTVNVDEQLVNDTNLQLFYYEETYEVEGETYTFILDENKDIKEKDNKQFDSINWQTMKITISGNEYDLGTPSIKNTHEEKDTAKIVFKYGDEKSNIRDYETFITGISSVVLGKTDTDKEVSFSLIYIGDGVWGIDLSEPKTSLFTGSRTCRLSVLANGIEIASVEKFTLTGNASISAKDSLKVSDIFYDSQLSTGSIDMSAPIIGVASSVTSDDAKNWVNGTTSKVEVSTDAKATFTVGDAVTFVKYSIYEITYTFSSTGSSLYNNTAIYYAIIGADDVVNVNYTDDPRYLYVSSDIDSVDVSSLIRVVSMDSSNNTIKIDYQAPSQGNSIVRPDDSEFTSDANYLDKTYKDDSTGVTFTIRWAKKST